MLMQTIEDDFKDNRNAEIASPSSLTALSIEREMTHLSRVTFALH